MLDMRLAARAVPLVRETHLSQLSKDLLPQLDGLVCTSANGYRHLATIHEFLDVEVSPAIMVGVFMSIDCADRNTIFFL